MSEPAPDLWAVVIRSGWIWIPAESTGDHVEQYVAPEVAELRGFLMASWMGDETGRGSFSWTSTPRSTPAMPWSR